MTLRRASFALSLVALAAPAAASEPQPASSPASAAIAPAAPSTPAQPPPATTSAATPPAKTDTMASDPAAIAFGVSADHDAKDSAGPKLLKYVIDFVPVAGAPGTSYSVDLGKPQPVEGEIAVPLTKVLLPGIYLAHVRAIGRGLQAATATVGPFAITEKSAKTQMEFDKEMRARREAQERQVKQNKKLKVPDSRPAAPSSDTPETEPGKEGSKPAGKGGFWKKFYEKVVG